MRCCTSGRRVPAFLEVALRWRKATLGSGVTMEEGHPWKALKDKKKNQSRGYALSSQLGTLTQDLGRRRLGLRQKIRWEIDGVGECPTVVREEGSCEPRVLCSTSSLDGLSITGISTLKNLVDRRGVSLHHGQPKENHVELLKSQNRVLHRLWVTTCEC